MNKWRGTEGLLHLSHDRKVSPRGGWQESRHRWYAQIPNSFGLPAGRSCPGLTPFCDSCYGARAEQQTPVEEMLAHNLAVLEAAGTAPAMTVLLTEMVERFVIVAGRRGLSAKEMIFRVHWDGDFWSDDYAVAWARTMQQYPHVKFWAYTRSFGPALNVVPILEGVPNLALYLSVDQWNAAAAERVVASGARVSIAACADTLENARLLIPDRKIVHCPENAGRLALMEEGKGACVSCMLCPDARRDIAFTTVKGARRNGAPMSVRIRDKMCGRVGCNRRVPHRAGPGRPAVYCSRDCQVAAYVERRKGQKMAKPLKEITVEIKADMRPVLRALKAHRAVMDEQNGITRSMLEAGLAAAAQMDEAIARVQEVVAQQGHAVDDFVAGG